MSRQIKQAEQEAIKRMEREQKTMDNRGETFFIDLDKRKQEQKTPTDKDLKAQIITAQKEMRAEGQAGWPNLLDEIITAMEAAEKYKVLLWESCETKDKRIAELESAARKATTILEETDGYTTELREKSKKSNVRWKTRQWLKS